MDKGNTDSNHRRRYINGNNVNDSVLGFCVIHNKRYKEMTIEYVIERMASNKQTKLERLTEGMQALLSLWCDLLNELNRMDGRTKERKSVIEEIKRVDEAREAMRKDRDVVEKE